MIRSSLLSNLTAYPSKGATPIFPVTAGQQACVWNARVYNNSGGSINLGILQSFHFPKWSLFQWTDVGPVITNVGALVSAGTAKNVFTTTNNDGFVVGANDMFGMIGMTVSTASAAGAWEYKYWNGAWVTLTTLEVPTNYSATGTNLVVFQAPFDWIKGGTTGLNQSQYNIRVRATTGTTNAVAINALWVAKFLELYQGVGNNGAISFGFPTDKPLLLDAGDTLLPYFATANAANQVGALYTLS